MKKTELIFGFHAVHALLHTRPNDVLHLFVLSGRQDKRLVDLLQLAQSQGVTCTALSRDQLSERVGMGRQHQGVVAECHTHALASEADLFDLLLAPTAPLLLLILDGVQDPHNLGACLRSANAFGVHAVIVPKDRSTKLTEVARKVACGAADQTSLITVTNLKRTMQKIQQAGVWLVGLEMQSEMTLSSLDLTGSVGIVMGGEGAGVRRLTRETCDYLAYIPMQGVVESLNVSVATGVALYEVQRQRLVLQ